MMLEFCNVGLSYDGKKIFSDLSFKISEGEKVLFKGKSGSGKSSAVELILGFLQPDGGQILYDGKPSDVRAVREFRRKCALVPQGINFAHGETVRGFIDEIFSFKANRNIKPDDAAIISAAKAVNMDNELLNNEINDLSGGEKQRISILAALLLKREIIIADEPTSALDSENSLKIIKLLLKEQKRIMN